ncbi:MAG: hypothetical protein Q4F72_00475 [Desulfovibrionaceae bacterium]|nr:hypothetical protein [Desulfovibrionaceae bacterium]
MSDSARARGARRALGVLLVLLALGLSTLGGCREGEKPAADRQESATQAERQSEAAPAPEAERRDGGEEAAQAASSGRRVYALSEPGEPASPEERARALRIVDYANRVDRTFNDACGQEPAQIMAGVLLYKQEYDAFLLAAKPSPANCLRRALGVPKNLFTEQDGKSMNDSLSEMDAQRTAMRKTYEQLCDYVADLEIRDDGVRGAKLSREIGEHLVRYARASSAYRAVLDREATAAQDALLRDHPLRDHVALAMQITSIVQQQAGTISLADPDPGSLEAPLNELEDKIRTAGRLPFPIAGEPEMRYRHFLREAERLAAVLRAGQLESFHSKVRQDLNEAWQACRRQYNLFVDAVNAL